MRARRQRNVPVHVLVVSVHARSVSPACAVGGCWPGSRASASGLGGMRVDILISNCYSFSLKATKISLCVHQDSVKGTFSTYTL